MANISQRITLEGGDDIRAKLQELARVAAAAFREIESAAGKVKVDPAAAKSFEELSSVTSKLAEEFNKLGDGASTTAPAIEKTGIAAGAASGEFNKLAESEAKVVDGLSQIADASRQVAEPVKESAEGAGLAYANFGLQVVKTGAAVAQAGASIATAGSSVAGVGLQAVTAAASVGTFALSLGSTLVSAIAVAIPALAGVAKSLAAIATGDAKVTAALQDLERSTKGIGLNFENLQRAQAALEQVGISAETARKIIGGLAKEVASIKPDDAKLKELENTLGSLQNQLTVVQTQMQRGIITSGGEQQIAELNAKIKAVNAELARFPGSAVATKAKEAANELDKVVAVMRQAAAGQKDLKFDELTTAETKIDAVKKVLQETAKAGGNVVQTFLKIIASLPKEDALAVGKALGLSDEQITRVQRFGVELGKIDGLMRRLSEAGVTISAGDADAFDRMGAAMDRLDSAWERLKQSLASTFFSRLAAEGAAAFGNLASAIIEETAKVIESFNFVFAQIGTEAGKVASAFAGVFQPITTLMGQIAEGWLIIGNKAAEVGNQILQGWMIIFQKIGEALTTPVAGAWEWVKSSFQAVLDWIAEKWAAFKSVFGLGDSKKPDESTSGGSFARGGLLGGRGTGTSDSNLAWLSRGEYITPARAVRGRGVLAFLEELRRNGGNLHKALAGVGRFAEGGLFGIPRYAGGGLSQAQASTLGQVLNAFKSLIEKTGSGIISVMEGMANAAQSIVDSMIGLAEEVAKMNNDAQQKLSDLANSLINTSNQIISDATGGTGRVDPSFARGGLLGGRGTGTSDSNLAWLSRGEYVSTARTVRQPGVLAFLEALRRTGGNLRAVLDGMGRYALGGLVMPHAIPAMAGGGAMSNVTIQFPGLPPIGGLRASSAVVEELRQAAVLAQVRSGGRKPSRYS